MGNPKVSVVIPAYNHERYVGEAIQSVLNQTFQDFELIIINDGSTDDTEQEILKFKDERIRYFSQENRGLSATLNRGIELARGEYFNFLPSDDMFFPEKFGQQLRVFEKDPGLGVVFAFPMIVDTKGAEIMEGPVARWALVPYETKEEIFPALFERNFLSAPTALTRMDCFRKVGGFDESLKYAQDYDMWMRVLKYYDTRLLKQPLVKYRWHGANLTCQVTPKTELERAKVLLKAYKDLSIEDVFPTLRQRKDAFGYAEAYEKLASFMEKSGIPVLTPISQIYKDKRNSLIRSEVDFSQPGKEEIEARFELELSRRNDRKINLLIEALSLDRGGMEQVIFDLVRGLDPGLFKVVAVVVEKTGIIANRCREIGIPVEILRYDKAREYQEILERYQIDLVLSHYSTFGVRLAFEKGISSVSVLHNIYSWFPDNILSDFRSADPFVSKYIAVSEEVKEYTRYRFNIPSEKITVIPNGIDVEAYISRPPCRRFSRSELGFNDEDYVFVNVAAVSPPKGQNVILLALKKIANECPNVKVLSIGDVLDEAYFDFLKKTVTELQLTNHFRFIGFVGDIRPYLQIADAFLLTSFIEGWPLSVMEAMLHRLPVITTRVGGVSEILGNSGCGILLNNSYEDFRLLDVPSLDRFSRETSPRNAEEVAQAMKRFLEENEFWREAGKKGYERISKHFNLQRMIRSYEKELFSQFIEMEKSRRRQRLKKIYEQERLLQDREKPLEEMRSQIALVKEQLDSKINVKFQNIESQLNYILIRLSLKERIKGLIYRSMKKIHKLVPAVLRERHRNGYRRAFFDKVTPADKKLFFEQRTPAQEGEGVERGKEVGGTYSIERNPVRKFLSFKEEIKRGLPLELEKIKANHLPGLVSVVLPVYNQAHLLGESIESVLNQTYPNLELIIVNDGSTDDIEKVLSVCRKNPKVKILNQENQKLPRALSNGFRLARGEFFTWTSADNLMGQKQLEVQVGYLISHPEVQMVYANYDIIDDDGEPLLDSDYCSGYQKPFGSNHIHLPKDPSELNVIRNNYIGPCFMYRSWVGKLIGDYDPSMFTMEDYDYWMTINAFFRIEHLGKEDILYFNRVHRNSLTGRKEELKIVGKTDRLMEFEKVRREFYRKKFNVYLIGNDDRLSEIKGILSGNGNYLRQFHIPCEAIQMEKDKALGIWIHSSFEKGFISRVVQENPHAFFVRIQLDPENSPDGELLKNFGMKVSVPRKEVENPQDDLWFYAEDLFSIFYPILCKANVELFRRKESFGQWNP